MGREPTGTDSKRAKPLVASRAASTSKISWLGSSGLFFSEPRQMSARGTWLPSASTTLTMSRPAAGRVSCSGVVGSDARSIGSISARASGMPRRTA